MARGRPRSRGVSSNNGRGRVSHQSSRPRARAGFVDDEINQSSVSSDGVVHIEDDEEPIRDDTSTQPLSNVPPAADDIGQTETVSEVVESKVPGELQDDESNINWNRSFYLNYGYFEQINNFPLYVR